MTAVQALIEHLENQGIEIDPKVRHNFLVYETLQIEDAMYHALDEDGHTGDWRVKFVKDYIKKL
jgi:hypothetical protein